MKIRNERKLVKALTPKLAWIRPDSRNAALDYQIPAVEAEKFYNEGKLARDLTNGGYMPNRWRGVL